MTIKISAEKSLLRAKLIEEIRAWVLATLEDSSVSPSSFLGETCEKRKSFYRTLRRKMTNVRQWRRLESALAAELIDNLLTRELKRHERGAPDPAQFTLPGFEHLPRRIRTGRTSTSFEKLSVGQLLVFADRYETRERRNHLAAEELTRLAALIRDQPPEITVPEALARVNGPVGRAETKVAARKA